MEQKHETITLTLYEWAQLLKILEFKMGFKNVDLTHAIHLYKKIGTQLYGQQVTVEIEGKVY